ncbi:MAG: hypothetical protein HPY64_12640 [Anaerolineae bacterium]|nr:hypothetical protein [Anaerolineae bacterium]
MTRSVWRLVTGVVLALVLARPADVARMWPQLQDRLPLRYGDSVTGTISHARFFQQYSFNGAAGDRVVITMEALSGNLDPLLLLGDAALNLIAEDDDSGGGFNARLEVTLPADGVYIVEATRYGQDSEAGQSTGDFRLTLLVNQGRGRTQDQPAGIFAPLTFGNTSRGLLSQTDRFRLFWFYAQGGDRVAVRNVLSAGMKATLVLYDPAFVELQRDPAGQVVEEDLAVTGIYFVGLALAADSPAGTYAVRLSGSAGDVTGDDALPLAYGDAMQGSLDDDHPADRYNFQGRTNDQVIIRMQATGRGLDPFLYLYGPEGEIVGQDDDGAGAPDAELAVVLPVDGQYTVVASRFGGTNGASAGGYTLTLEGNQVNDGTTEGRNAGEALPADFQSLPRVRYGDVITDRLDNMVPYRAYVFQARAGDTVEITMQTTQGDLDPALRLLNGRLETLAEHDDISAANKNARLTQTIPADGYYAILASRYNGEAGTTSGGFRLAITAPGMLSQSQIATLLPAQTLYEGETLNGQLADVPGTLYRFFAAAGDTVELTLETSGPLQEEGLIILADPALRELAVSASGSLRYTIPQDGMYTVIVSRLGGPLGTARGFFRLSLAGADPTAAERLGGGSEPQYQPGDIVPYGVVLIGAIDSTTPRQTYRFLGQQGDRISITLEALDATLDPLLILLGPDGTPVMRDNDSAGNLNALIGPYLLTQGGEYTIVATRAGEGSGTSRGRYELTLNGIPVTQPEIREGQTGADLATALPLAPGQTVSGSISDSQVAVFYALDGVAGTTIQVDMVRLEGDLDAFLAVLDPAQTLVAFDDDSAGRQNARVIYTFPLDGRYYVVASRYGLLEGTTSGEYLLSVVAR